MSLGLPQSTKRLDKAVERKKAVVRKYPSTNESSEEFLGGDIRRNLEETLGTARSEASLEEFETVDLRLEPVELENVELELGQLELEDRAFEKVNLRDGEAQDRI